ncbi:hypothetical protein CCO03_05970 [Comamonas serinivorans]|uniref:DUF4349 domain-containing protein n=1 Tax=Comamonas serinivorans TaxID=1082851 RepID=A0A1Y0EKX7_9BURK|nr:DUF4349 domain-containing protein [Comamonas serinivorans]ARU04284.1 hypothetical protein CCO03_05970 [Comamonas serinivorans]
MRSKTVGGNAPLHGHGLRPDQGLQPMWRRAAGALAVALLVGLAGCSRSEAPAATAEASLDEPAALAVQAEPTARAVQAEAGTAMDEAKVAARDASGGAGAGDTPLAPRRFLAVRHQLQVEAPADQVAEVWAAVREACGRLDCDLVSAQLQRETAQTPVSAALSLRVAPQDYARLTGALSGGAKVVSDASSSEDLTAQVVDVEAHLKNRSEYRDSLRELLADKSVKRTLAELFQIRDTLAQVQAEIDSALTQRQLLEQQTAKQFVQMQFRAERGLQTATHYNPWREVLRDAVNLAAESTHALVRVVALVLPWGLALVALGWALRWWLRRRSI